MLFRIAVDGALALEGPANFRQFAIMLSADAPADAALARLGRRDGAHIWITPAAIRALLPTPPDRAWEEGFAAMLAFATTRGWVDEAGAIRAHIEAA